MDELKDKNDSSNINLMDSVSTLEEAVKQFLAFFKVNLILANPRFKDFKVISEAAIVFIFDTDKLERLNTLNQSLSQVENCKEITKWIIKIISLTLRQNIDEQALTKHFMSSFGIDEHKSSILKDLCSKHWSKLRAKLENQDLMISQLVDMEWNFGVTASTNYIDKLGNAFLQLKLVYNKGGNLETSFMGI